MKMTPKGENTFSKLIALKRKSILKAKVSGFLQVARFVAKSCNLGSIDCAKTQWPKLGIFERKFFRENTDPLW